MTPPPRPPFPPDLPLLDEAGPLVRPYLPAYGRQVAHLDLAAVIA
ncbi:hypothetical protein AB0D04_24625 [Streptomyces sp. NPDC048483]